MKSNITKKFNREIKYSNKDFAEFRSLLINHAKNYFRNTYKDFNEADPGMMFIEMAASVGDVLSFYSDVQLQESFLTTVNEKINLYNLAQSLGYKPRTLVPAQVDLDIMQLIPSIGSGIDTKPDWSYALSVKENLQASTTDGIKFRTVDSVDFRFSSSLDPTTVSIYSEYPDGNIEYYLIKKCVKAVAGEIISETFEFTDPKIYDKIVLNTPNISDIIDIKDDQGDVWYEVPFLAQDLILVPQRNIAYNDTELAAYSDTVPYLLTYIQTEKRFITRLRKDDKIEIQFGSGLSTEADEEIVPNPYNVAIGLDYFKRVEDVSIDPMNFLYTKTYGRAPNNTILTVRYALSNGELDNVDANTITNIDDYSVSNPHENVNMTIFNSIKDSLAINNALPAYGGLNKKPLEVIREESMANFAAQNRSVTKDDLILRCYTMPQKFGGIAKAYAELDTQIPKWNQFDRIPNKFSLNLYVLGFNDSKNFVTCNKALKENLRQYLLQYKMMTDAINIKDPYIINIGIEMSIVTRPSFNSNEVSIKCIDKMKELLHNDYMEIGSPIILSKLYTEIDRVEGVQTVQEIKILNLYDSNLGYSGNVYDVDTATREGVLYPSKDVCVFEVKYPNNDIKCRVIDI